jgi:predicted membrane protein
VVGAGAFGNGLAFMAGGALVGWLLDETALVEIHRIPDQARLMIVITTGITGAIIGAIVLEMFRRSENLRKRRRLILHRPRTS